MVLRMPGFVIEAGCPVQNIPAGTRKQPDAMSHGSIAATLDVANTARPAGPHFLPMQERCQPLIVPWSASFGYVDSESHRSS